APGASRIDLSRAAPARATWMDHGGVGTIRQQPQREVLRAHQAWPQTTGGGVRSLGAPDRSSRGCSRYWVTEPTMLREAWNDVRYRVRTLLRRDDAERNLTSEIEDHLAREAEALERAGWSPADAKRQARLAFGGLEAIKEDTRDAWGTALL